MNHHVNSALFARENFAKCPKSDEFLQMVAEDAFLRSKFGHSQLKLPSGSKSTFLTIVSPNGQLLASTNGDHCVHVFNVSNGKLLHSLRGHTRTPWAVAFHPTSNDLLASGCLAGDVFIWDLKSGCSENCFKAESDTAVASLAFHPFERLLFIATVNKLILFDWSSKSIVKVLETGSIRERVRYVKFCPYGNYLYTAITNIDRPADRRAQHETPPPVMPYRCQQLLESRRELMQMREDLSRRHDQLLVRYNDLLTRYRTLQRQYPDFADANLDSPSASEAAGPNAGAVHDPGSTSTSASSISASAAAASNANAQDREIDLQEFLATHQFRNPIEIAARSRMYNRDRMQTINSVAASQPSTSASHLDSITLFTPEAPAPAAEAPAPPSAIGRSSVQSPNPFRMHDGEDSDEDGSGRLSPIALEGLQDTVAYARDITQSSMSEFMRRHRESVDRLHQSYHELSRSAQRLIQMFQSVYEDMARMQERINQSVDENDSGNSAAAIRMRNGTRTLLLALTRMQEILIANSVQHAQHQDVSATLDARIAALGREISAMEEVYSSIFENIDELNFDQEMLQFLRNSHARMVELKHRAERIAAAAPSVADCSELRRQFQVEVQAFKCFMRRWKMSVLQTLRSPRAEAAENEVPAASADRSSTVEFDLPGPSSSQQFFNPDDARIDENVICEGAGPGRRFRALHRDASTDEEPIHRICNVRVSRMHREQEAALEAERHNADAERNNEIQVNLSPTRIQQREPGDSPNTIRYRMTVGGGSANSSTGGGSDSAVPPSKMRRLDFSTPPSDDGPSGSLSRTNVAERILEATQRRYGNVDGQARCTLANSSATSSNGGATERPRCTLANSAATSSNGANERPRLIPFHRRPSTAEPARVEYAEIRSNRPLRTAEDRVNNNDDSSNNFTFLRPTVATAQGAAEFERINRDRSSVLLGDRTLNVSDPSGGEGTSNGSAIRRPSWLFEMRDRPGGSSSASSVFAARRDFARHLMGEQRYPSPPPIIQPPPRLNRPVDLFAEDDEDSSSLYRAINRAIAGAFIGSGEIAIANNILDLTARIQRWPLDSLPDLTQDSTNVVARRCKLHNDGSIAISNCGTLMAVFVQNSSTRPSHWADTTVQIISLEDSNFGQILWSKAFGPNAISISLSPTAAHVMIGFAAKRYLRLPHTPQTCAQILRLFPSTDMFTKPELVHIAYVEHSVSDEMPNADDPLFPLPPRPVSLNCCAFLPVPGQGIAYGTNRGQVYLITSAGHKNAEDEQNGIGMDDGDFGGSSDDPDSPLRMRLRRVQARLNLLENL